MVALILLAVQFDAARCKRVHGLAREKKKRSGTSEDKKPSKVISCTIKKERTVRKGERIHDFTTINAISRYVILPKKVWYDSELQTFLL